MQEYVSDAIVLTKAPLKDLDGRYVLFSRRFGKIVAKAKSSRKITSKLAPHLEPGNIVKARFIEKGGTQIVDALKIMKIPLSLHDLRSISDLLPEAEPEEGLWNMLAEGTFTWPGALAVFGWDPSQAECFLCGGGNVAYFYLRSQEFFCVRCASKLPRDAVVLL